ncbi:HNH endonuclease [Embleya hyalina]|uniref:HNH endonuclease n=1 Tax=Embleya hyalina TaxID=516124 RepID=A0A401Z5S9_9ACTN|nr:HNH endonuclease signature motif containing protein [Embleya hyalina]GCE02176.1 HNH endonuclease [Embleya hyalina]
MPTKKPENSQGAASRKPLDPRTRQCRSAVVCVAGVCAAPVSVGGLLDKEQGVDGIWRKVPDGPSCIPGWLVQYAKPHRNLEVVVRRKRSEDGRFHDYEYGLACTLHLRGHPIGRRLVPGAREGEYTERNKLWCPDCTPGTTAAQLRVEPLPEETATTSAADATIPVPTDYRRRVRDLEAPDRGSLPPRETAVLRLRRSREARSLVVARSGGRCESPVCASGDFREVTPAGEPILEVDHVRDLAGGGRDHPENMIALCPNCHAVKTRGTNAERLREILRDTARQRHARAMETSTEPTGAHDDPGDTGSRTRARGPGNGFGPSASGRAEHRH